MSNTQQISIQAKVFDFAFSELVRNHRNSFQPLWTVDSWAKFLIWIALNCGVSGDTDSLQIFADSLGISLITRMRKLFFERSLEEQCCNIIADPAEKYALVMPTSKKVEMDFQWAITILEDIELSSRVVLDQSQWQKHDNLIAIPWKSLETDSSLSQSKEIN